MSSNRSTNNNTDTLDNAQRRDSALYSALMARYLHQDRLLWSRTQLLIVVQAGILAAGFSQRGHWFAFALMFFGALLTLLILSIVLKDERDRDVNNHIMYELADERIRLTADPPFGFIGRWFMRGGRIIKGVLILFFIIDIVLGALYTWADCLFL
jgi:hypothetical protein